MMDTLNLELDLITVGGHALPDTDRHAIQRFIAEGTLDAWIHAANVTVARHPATGKDETLVGGLMATRYYLSAQHEYYRMLERGLCEWFKPPQVAHVIEHLRVIAGTAANLPGLDLELDLARAANNKLTSDERLALQRLYYRPSVEHLMAARNIVLLEEAGPEGQDLTFIMSLDQIAPDFLERNMGDGESAGRVVKVFTGAPTSELTYAALVRATH